MIYRTKPEHPLEGDICSENGDKTEIYYCGRWNLYMPPNVDLDSSIKNSLKRKLRRLRVIKRLFFFGPVSGS
jgi:hypothetical protein